MQNSKIWYDLQKYTFVFYISLSNTLVSTTLTAQLKSKFKHKDIIKTHFCVQRKGWICTSL